MSEKRITQEYIARLRKTMTDNAAAQVYDDRARTIEREVRASFTELGLIVKEVEERRLWQHVVKADGDLCHSLDDWIADALPVSSRTAYSALKVARTLEHIPVETRAKIAPGNLKTMAEMSSSLSGSPAILQEAVEMKPKEFREKVSKDHPEQHIEALRPMERLNPTVSQRKVYEEAFKMAETIDGCKSREEAMEVICFYYTSSQENQKLLFQAKYEQKHVEVVH